MSEKIYEKIPSKNVLLVHIESLFIELNFRKYKWLLFETYHPPSQQGQDYHNYSGKTFDTHCHNDKILLSCDFNCETSEVCLDSFLYQHKLTHPVPCIFESCIEIKIKAPQRSMKTKI